MKLKYLGTAAAEGIPGVFCNCDICNQCRNAGEKNIRTRSQALLDDAILIDFPADTYMHMLMHRVRLDKIQTCLITHSHSDHLYSPEIVMRVGAMAHGPEGTLTFYVTQDGYEKLMAEIHHFSLENSDRVKIHKIENKFENFTVQGYQVTPLSADHSAEYGSVIYAIEHEGKRLLYAHDTGIFPDETWAYLERVEFCFDCVSLDCTAFRLHGWKTGHMDLESCVAVKDRMMRVGAADQDTKFVLNHFSHNAVYLHEQMQKIADQYNFTVAWDGMEISF
jgi:hypothetical protein